MVRKTLKDVGKTKRELVLRQQEVPKGHHVLRILMF
jgi:hypothetical protein